MKQRFFLSSEWQDLKAVIGIFLFYFLMGVIFNIGCPILWLTGISCAGCGMTRAWFYVFCLDFESAFYYHPLFWLPAAVLFFYFFRKKMSKHLVRILSLIAVLMFLIIYLLRMLDPSNNIVIFQPWEGIIGKLLSQLLNKI